MNQTDPEQSAGAMNDNRPTDSSTFPESQETGSTTHDLRQHAEEAKRMTEQDKQDDRLEADANDAIRGGYTSELSDPEARRIIEQMERAATSSDRSFNRRIFDEKTLLRIDIQDANPLIVEVRKDIIIGRSDNITDYIPDLDFTPYGAYRLGLSRRHAILRRSDNRLEIMDLGSRNGTLINGERLQPKETRVLQDGDILHFGNLRLQFIFERKPYN